MPNLLPGLLISLIWIGPLCLALTPFLMLGTDAGLLQKFIAIAVALPIFAFSFALVAGLLSLPSQRKIIRGRFPRKPFHRIYFWRRLYGCCWTNIFYFKPLYFVFLSIPVLKKSLFLLFGYKGPLNFTVYPDTWLRDLPLLHFGENSYCSNRSTIGTNMCLQDGSILVDRVHIGANAMLGHLSMVAPGVKLEKDVEVGAGVALGIRCRMKEGARIGAGSSVNHGSIFGARSETGGHSHIGLQVEIGDDIKVPAGANIPAGAIIATQEDVDKYLSSENQALRTHVAGVAEVFRTTMEAVHLKD